MPKIAECQLKSVSPYSMSKPHFAEKLTKEAPDDYEHRTWRERCHANEEDQLYIPGVAFKNSIIEAAAFLAEKRPGKGAATWTKHFTAGIMVPEPLMLPIKKADVKPFQGYMHADGNRKSGKRVMRYYPEIPSWAGVVKFYILDSAITEDVFKRTLIEAGNLIGIGRWRPINRGENGRFKLEAMTWRKHLPVAA